MPGRRRRRSRSHSQRWHSARHLQPDRDRHVHLRLNHADSQRDADPRGKLSSALPSTSSWRPFSQYGLAGALSTVAVATVL
jgi:hypothetical protein